MPFLHGVSEDERLLREYESDGDRRSLSDDGIDRAVIPELYVVYGIFDEFKIVLQIVDVDVMLPGHPSSEMDQSLLQLFELSHSSISPMAHCVFGTANIGIFLKIRKIILFYFGA